MSGYLDGPGDVALFDAVEGLTVDSQGTVYVADTGNCRVRSIDPNGLVSTVAGNGCTTTDGGDIPSLPSPRSIALGASGELYVAACTSVRKIDQTGNIVLLAQVPESECALGIAISPQGAIYVSVQSRILRVDQDAGLVPFAGSGILGFADGTPDQAQFNSLFGLAIDAQGNLYVADGFNNRVRLIDASGNVTTLAGNGAPAVQGSGTTFVQQGSAGPYGTAEFYEPTGLALNSSSNVYVVSYQDACIGVIENQSQ